MKSKLLVVLTALAVALVFSAGVYAESGDTPAEPGTSVTVLQDDFGQEGSPVTEEPDKEVPAEGTEPEVPAEGTET